MIFDLLQLDRAAFYFFHRLFRSPYLDSVMDFFTSPMGIMIFMTGGLLVGFFLMRKKNFKKNLLTAFLALGLSDGIASQIIKPTLGRLRPCQVDRSLSLGPEKCSGLYGFPSNHGANSAAFVGPWILEWGVFSLPGILLLSGVGLIGYSRIYWGMHYPLDIVGGWILGILVFFILRRIRCLVSWIQKKRGGLPPPKEIT